MDVAALCPFEVGVLRWSAPTPALTVVIKATWRLDRPVAALADEQDALSGDRFGPGDSLTWASDFAPYKPRADVLVVGHARAASPTQMIPVRVNVDDFERFVYAMSGEPCTEMPLTGAHLRVSPRLQTRPTALGPNPPWLARPLFGAAPTAGVVGADGVPLGPLGVDFDFGVFNTAPLEQQTAALREDAVIALEGLAPGLPRFQSQLPGMAPRVFLASTAGAPTCELAVACDTLVIDCDRMLAVTVWRGAIVLEAAEPTLVVVAAQAAGEVLDWPAVLGDIFSARYVRATELTPAPSSIVPEAPGLPKLYDDDPLPTVARWGDETTTRVHASRPPPPLAPRRAPIDEGDDTRDVRGRKS